MIPDRTIRLTSGELVIDKDITIAGPGRNGITIRRDVSDSNPPFFRIFRVIEDEATEEGGVTLSGLVIQGGLLSNAHDDPTRYDQSYGGGIYNGPPGRLTITDSLVSNNTAGGIGVNEGPFSANGGGVFSEGALTVVDSTFTSNSASDVPLTRYGQPFQEAAGYGGGIWNNGTLNIIQSTITGNSIRGPADGPNHPNVEYSKGGAICTTPAGTLDMTRTVVRQNGLSVGSPAPSLDVRGGGLFLSGTSTITDSMIDRNNEGGYYGSPVVALGGGIYNNDGNLTITRTSITANNATGGGSSDSLSVGGGICNTPLGTVGITNSTLSGNQAGWDNTAPIPRTALGGAIANYGTLSVTASTIANNVAVGYVYDSGQAVAGGGVYHPGPATNAAVNTSILAGNESFQETFPPFMLHEWVGPDAYGAFTSDGYNLVGKRDGSGGWLPSDLTGTEATPLDAKLGPLQNNGGPPIGVTSAREVFRTHEVLPDSPALQAGNPAATPATDQRGVERDHPRPNVGAYEATLAGFQVAQADPGPVYVNTPFSLRVTAVDPFGKTVYVYGGTVTFSSSDPGATLPPNYAFTAADHGSHVFTGVQFTLTGLQTITVSDLPDPTKSGVGMFDVVM
jgi:hypothetical protein